MGSIRNPLRARPWLVIAILVAALGLRVLMPQGLMPVIEQQRIELAICHGAGTAPATVEIDVPVKPAGEDPAERCAFADLSVPLIGGVDPFLVAAALAFVLALWLTFAAALPARQVPHLRPPLRGPPLSA